MRVLRASGLVVLVALLALVWVPPALAGPTVDCGGLSQEACDEAVPAVLKEARANVPYAALLPVTSVRLMDAPGCPLGYNVTWLFGFNWGYLGLC